MADQLIIRGAREHNLKDVSLDLPRDALIVFTGLSGSGKSSLAFDTIFAEGQRRYVESLSAYARQFLGQMDKPDVDFIEGLSPAVSIDQKSTSKNPRSTVGTITEVYDYLRLLFARIGRPHCPTCGAPIERQTPQQIVDQVLALEDGRRFQVLAPMIRGRKGEYVELFRQLQAQGFSRARIDGDTHQLDDPPKLDKQRKHTIEVVVDRLAVKESAKRRLTDSVETALDLAGGLVLLDFVDLDAKDPGRELRFSEKMSCPNEHPIDTDGSNRARSRSTARSAPARSATGSAPGSRSTPSSWCPTRRRRSARARSSRGARPTWPTTSNGCWARWATSSASTSTPRGRTSPPSSRSRCCEATPPRSTSSPATATAVSAPTTPSSRACRATSSGATARRSPTPAASASRASCARCRARRAAAPGSSRSRSR